MHYKRLIHITVFCLYIIGVLYLCFAKPEEMPQLPELIFGLPADKLGHFLMFAPFPVLGYMVFTNNDLDPAKKVMLLCTLATCGFMLAAVTEQIQAILSYRSADMKDLAADALGLAVGGVATIFIIVKKR